MIKNKTSIKRVVLLNKIDLADNKETKRWKEQFENNEYKVIETIGDTGKGIDELKKYLESLQKGVNTTKTIIMGIPNVGKSTIINKLLGKNSLEVKNKAGATKKLQQEEQEILKTSMCQKEQVLQNMQNQLHLKQFLDIII